MANIVNGSFGETAVPHVGKESKTGHVSAPEWNMGDQYVWVNQNKLEDAMMESVQVKHMAIMNR